jgi:hypothetical protein
MYQLQTINIVESNVSIVKNGELKADVMVCRSDIRKAAQISVCTSDLHVKV